MSLTGIRVIELGAYISAPLASKFLADLGASVLKVEPPLGDPARRWGTAAGDSPWFGALNMGKESITLNLTSSQADKETFHNLLKGADVLITNLSKDCRHSAGVDLEPLEKYPQLIRCIIHPSPHGHLSRAFDSLAQATTGICGYVGARGDPQEPNCLPFPIADVMAAHSAVSATLLGLLKREKTGSGPLVGTDLCSPVATLMIEHLALQPSAAPAELNADRLALAQIYFINSKDNRWVVAHLSSKQNFWLEFCDVLRLPSHFRDLSQSARRTSYEHIVRAARTASHTRSLSELSALLGKTSIPHTVVPVCETQLSEVLSEYMIVADGCRSVRVPFYSTADELHQQKGAPKLPLPSTISHLSDSWKAILTKGKCNHE